MHNIVVNARITSGLSVESIEGFFSWAMMDGAFDALRYIYMYGHPSIRQTETRLVCGDNAGRPLNYLPKAGNFS